MSTFFWKQIFLFPLVCSVLRLQVGLYSSMWAHSNREQTAILLSESSKQGSMHLSFYGGQPCSTLWIQGGEELRPQAEYMGHISVLWMGQIFGWSAETKKGLKLAWDHLPGWEEDAQKPFLPGRWSFHPKECWSSHWKLQCVVRSSVLKATPLGTSSFPNKFSS